MRALRLSSQASRFSPATTANAAPSGEGDTKSECRSVETRRDRGFEPGACAGTRNSSRPLDAAEPEKSGSSQYKSSLLGIQRHGKMSLPRSKTTGRGEM